MKKIIYVCLTLCCLFSFKTKLFALCEDQTLNDFAEKVELILYDESFISNDEEGVEYAYVIHLSEEQEGLYLKVKDSLYSEEFIVNYDSELKNYIIGSFIHYVPKRYVVEVYVQDDYKVCKGEKLKTLTITVPPHNEYADTEYCETHSDEAVCQKHVDNSNITLDEFNNLVNNSPTTFKSIVNSIWDAIVKYWLYVLIPASLVAIYFIVKIYIYKKKEEKE